MYILNIKASLEQSIHKMNIKASLEQCIKAQFCKKYFSIFLAFKNHGKINQKWSYQRVI